jgi:hypothetical protein
LNEFSIMIKKYFSFVSKVIGFFFFGEKTDLISSQRAWMERSVEHKSSSPHPFKKGTDPLILFRSLGSSMTHVLQKSSSGEKKRSDPWQHWLPNIPLLLNTFHYSLVRRGEFVCDYYITRCKRCSELLVDRGSDEPWTRSWAQRDLGPPKKRWTKAPQQSDEASVHHSWTIR